MSRVHVPVTAISSLIGQHDYRDSNKTLRDLLRPTKKHPVFDHVKRLLFRSDLYERFCAAAYVSHRLRVLARKYVDAACEQAGVRFNRPYSYFMKQRGLYQERQNTNRAETVFQTKIKDRQLRIQKSFKNFVVQGSIDGRSDQFVYEIKTRANVLNVQPWEKSN